MVKEGPNFVSVSIEIPKQLFFLCQILNTSVKRSVSEVEEDEEDDEDDDDFDDETILERLVALTEMFPEGLTHFADASASGLVSGLKWAYKASRTVSWIVCTSASIMFLPIMIETERMGIEEAQKQQQRQILLGNFRFWFA